MQLTDWFSRLKREREARNLTPAQYLVLCELGRFGRCRFGIVPSHATLAARARVCIRTVQRALDKARELGLLTWCERRIKAAWRLLKTSNRYALAVPSAPVSTTGQKARQGTYERKQGADRKAIGEAVAMMAAAGGRRDLLDRRVAALTTGWLRLGWPHGREI